MSEQEQKNIFDQASPASAGEAGHLCCGSHQPGRCRCRGFNFGRLFLGLVLVLGGLLFLARNFGWLRLSDINIDWQKIWPLFLILVGLSMIRTKKFLATILGVIATIVILAAIVWIIFGAGNFIAR